jgi:predicted Zn-dependent protease
LLRALPAVEAFADDRVLFLTRRELATRALESGPAPTNGLAEYHGQRCVVTVAGMGDVRPDAIRTLARYAMHELGHTFGLHHCLDPRCAMYPHWTRSFASGEASFCTYCREKSEQRVRQGKS